MTDSKIAERKAHLPFLIFACVASALGGFLWGFDAIVISGTITLVKAQFALGSAMEGLYVSSGLIGAVIGSAAAGTLSERLGRRRNLILAATLLLVSALGSMLAGSIGLLVLSRWIGGLGVGISAMVCPVYISEMSPAKLRGRLVTVFQFAITFGIMAALFNNAGLNSWSNSLAEKGSVEGFWKWVLVDQTWRSMFGSELLPGAIFFVLALFLPESPRWLIKSGIKDKARKVLSLIYKQGGEDVLDAGNRQLHPRGDRDLV